MTGTEIAAVLGGVGTLVGAVSSAVIYFRKGNADVGSKQTTTSIREGKARQKQKEEATDYIISKWQELYDNLNEKVEELLKKEAECQKRLVRAETLLSQLCERFGVPYPSLKDTDSGEMPALPPEGGRKHG